MSLKFIYDKEIKESNINIINNLRSRVKYLYNIPQPAQRSEEWYEMRKSMITASDWGTVLGDNPYSNIKRIYLNKCGAKQPFFTNDAMKWGVKYEDVAVSIYKLRNNTNIIEFGVLKHEKYNFLGASPDGITADGVMLEIKCPSKRKITGDPPKYYWDQVQGQLEVCELNRCDFLECKFEEYENEEEYFNDIGDSHFYGSNNKEKGCVLVFFDRKTKSENYVYSEVGITKENYTKWLNENIEKNSDKIYVESSFWNLKEISCVPIYRDKEWFANALIKLRECWQKVLFFRENPSEYESYISSSKKKKKSNSIFIDTQISNYNIINENNSDSSNNLKKCMFTNLINNNESTSNRIDKNICMFSNIIEHKETDNKENNNININNNVQNLCRFSNLIE